MKPRIAALAKQLLSTVPKPEMAEPIQVLTYFNRFAESDRVRALENGSQNPDDPRLEKELQESTELSSASQGSYVTPSKDVCRCCGK